MTNLTPTESFDNVVQLETTTLALGGPSGPMNAQAQALLNRTAFLDNKIDQNADDLAAPGGSADVGFQSSGAGSVPRTAEQKLKELPTPADFGAHADGVSNDTETFSNLEIEHQGLDIDLLGKTYLVDSIPSLNRYHSGFFKVGANTLEPEHNRPRNGQGISAFDDALTSLPPGYQMAPNQFTYGNHCFAQGQRAGSELTEAKQTIAMGGSAMEYTTKSFDNTAIGECALQSVQSAAADYSTTLVDGTRNIALGGNSLQFLTDGRNNLAAGRNSAVCVTSSVDAVYLGANALAGEVYAGWYPFVENFVPNTNAATEIAVVGAGIGHTYSGPSLTALGYHAGLNLKTGDSNLLAGNRAGMNLESLVGWGGKVRSDYPSDPYVTYVKTGSNVVVTAPGHAAVVGGIANIYWAVGGPCYANHGHPFPQLVTAVSSDTFTVQCPYIPDGSGNARLYWTTSLADAVKSRHNVMAGPFAGSSVNQAIQSVIIGSLAAQNVTLDMTSFIAIGYGAGQNLGITPTSAVIVGTNAMRDNTANIGSATAIGHNAGLLLQSGVTPNISVVNSTMLGSNSRVSGANQVQLGDSSTTTYVYGTVQNRSDIEDKYAVRDTVLGLEFVERLRPVDFKWDMRDDYVLVEDVEEIDGDGNTIVKSKVTQLPRDGSKKRNRYHHGVIAQEVRDLINETGVDFGGFQDHSIGGGCNVLSIGYDELIAPLIKAVQELSAELKFLKEKINSTQDK